MKDLNEDVRDFEMTLVNWNGVLYTNPDSIKEINQPDDKKPLERHRSGAGCTGKCMAPLVRAV